MDCVESVGGQSEARQAMQSVGKRRTKPCSQWVRAGVRRGVGERRAWGGGSAGGEEGRRRNKGEREGGSPHRATQGRTKGRPNSGPK